MPKFKLKKLAFTLSLGLSLSAAIVAHAAGLGTMTSTSKLGEPLNAEIELLAVAPGELNSIQAALADDQVYQDQMLEKPASYPYIQIEVGNNSKGQPILKLTSSQPITEAFLDMLIQVDWPTGRLVKEYTLLLDPPGFNSNYVSESTGLPVTAQPPVAAEAPKATAAPAVESAKPEASKPATKKPATARAESPKPSTPAEPPADNLATPDPLTTERGDTLYAIARQMKPDNVSVEQMLAALYRSNQDAFDGKNMNRLKVGKIIRMPDQAALNAISNQQAKNLVAEHNTNWLAYKNALSNVVKNSAASETGGNTQQSAGKIGSAQEKPVPQAPAGKDVLKLSTGDEKSGTQTDKAAAKAAANAAQEEATAKENAIKEEQSRAAALEKQVADMKKLMELKNNALSQAEKNAAQATSPEAKTPEPKAETPAATENKPVPAEVLPAPATELATPVPEKAPVDPAAIDPAVEPEQPSFMQVLLQRLKNISPVLPWALIALPILICVWALIRIRRKKEIDTFEDAILTAPATEMQNNTVFGDTQAASGDTSFLTDFSQSGVGGMIDSHDVDPIAEAEVYMAYGRDAQAEEILKDAIQKDPERQELKLKLLEIYQSTNNKGAFESLAGEVYANVGPSDQTWSKVVAMGQKLDSENSLYQMPALDNSSAEAPVVEAENAEQGYHFNFEAPALEFESSDKPARSVTEPSIVDDLSIESPSETAPEKFAELQTDFSVPDDTPVNKSLVDAPLNDESFDRGERADALPAFTEPALEDSLPEVAEEKNTPADRLESDSVLDVPDESDFKFEPDVPAETAEPAAELYPANDAELTPKALDLPSLNLDEESTGFENRRPDRTQSTTGEQTLSSDDAVFESLPELSLELGGPNDSAFNRTQEEDDAVEIEEISLDTTDDDRLSRVPEDSFSTENTFPEISLDVGAKPEDSLAEFDGEPEEVNTKLDLIQAYIDMEDMIGAKELIEEVLSEGGERQRQRASELLEKVA
ncbi:FimV/HubP family polar landmark protein [Methylophilus flavus]